MVCTCLTTNVRVTLTAAPYVTPARTPPAWFAVIEHDPAPTIATVVPLTVQTAGVDVV